MLKITIHRGTYQVGGCITEIATGTTRIFIDMGDNLPGEQEKLSDKQRKDLVDNIFANNKRADEAVFYTHSHPDHTGMMTLVPSHVVQYMNQGTKDILEIMTKVQLDRLHPSKRILELFGLQESFRKKLKNKIKLKRSSCGL